MSCFSVNDVRYARQHNIGLDGVAVVSIYSKAVR